MIKIKIIATGTLKEKFWTDAFKEYQKRLSRFCTFKLVELKEEKTLEKEGENIQKNLSGFVVAMDITGKKTTSEEFAKFIEKTSQTHSEITFVIGSSTGLCNQIKQTANERLSFSDMTFPHQMFRVMLAEQIYRAFSINEGVAYHK